MGEKRPVKRWECSFYSDAGMYFLDSERGFYFPSFFSFFSGRDVKWGGGKESDPARELWLKF